MTAWHRAHGESLPGVDLDGSLCWIIERGHINPFLAYWNGHFFTDAMDDATLLTSCVAWWTPCPTPTPPDDVTISFTKTGEDYVSAPDDGVELLRTAIANDAPVVFAAIPAPLTDRQRAVLDLIRSKITAQGYAPTLREIGEALGMKSTNGVADHVKALEKKGYIRRTYGTARSIVLTDGGSR